MRLIDADRLLSERMQSKFYHLPNGDTAVPVIDIEHAPTVEQPKIIRCKDCEYWVPGVITDQDDFIPPRCGKYSQMVGHSADDFCSLAKQEVKVSCESPTTPTKT